MALAACVLPLTLLAAVATGLRVDQHGPTPERLWALVFVVIGTAYGLSYLVALIRGRRGWATPARQGNLRLAFGVAAVALLLATPLVSFHAIATSAQVARLRDGRVSAERFDWAALKHDFGPPGERALAELARAADTRIAAKAQAAQRSTSRWDLAEGTRVATAAEQLAPRLTIRPAAVALPPTMAEALTTYEACGPERDERCVLLYRPGDREAFAVATACLTDRTGARMADQIVRPCMAGRLRVGADGRWTAERIGYFGGGSDAKAAAERAALRAGGAVAARPVERRQLHIGDVAVGDTFE